MKIERNRIMYLGMILLIFIIFINAYVYASARREKPISGVIVYMSDDVIEVKRGRRELLLSITPQTIFLNKSGNNADRSILELCATVRVHYVREASTLRAVQIQLIREGYCYR